MFRDLCFGLSNLFLRGWGVSPAKLLQVNGEVPLRSVAVLTRAELASCSWPGIGTDVPDVPAVCILEDDVVTPAEKQDRQRLGHVGDMLKRLEVADALGECAALVAGH